PACDPISRPAAIPSAGGSAPGAGCARAGSAGVASAAGLPSYFSSGSPVPAGGLSISISMPFPEIRCSRVSIIGFRLTGCLQVAGLRNRSLVRMLGSAVELELLQHLPPQFRFGKHPPDREPQQLFGLPLEQLGGRLDFSPPRIAGVVVVFLGKHLRREIR